MCVEGEPGVTITLPLPRAGDPNAVTSMELDNGDDFLMEAGSEGQIYPQVHRLPSRLGTQNDPCTTRIQDLPEDDS